MARYPMITEEKFTTTKTLLGTGLARSYIAGVVGLSVKSVDRIALAKDWKDFVQKKADFAEKYSNRNHAKEQAQKPDAVQETMMLDAPKTYLNPTVVRVEATHYMMQELQRTNELLALISNKLAFIVDELCGVPNQK